MKLFKKCQFERSSVTLAWVFKTLEAPGVSEAMTNISASTNTTNADPQTWSVQLGGNNWRTLWTIHAFLFDVEKMDIRVFRNEFTEMFVERNKIDWKHIQTAKRRSTTLNNLKRQKKRHLPSVPFHQSASLSFPWFSSSLARTMSRRTSCISRSNSQRSTQQSSSPPIPSQLHH